MNPKADFYFENDSKWQEEYKKLRAIILDCGLTEELKWGCPCYTNGTSNVVLIHGFKEYCAILFFKGALMNDPEGVMIQQSPNVQSARQYRFTNSTEITKQKNIIKSYVYEAIEIERAGLKVKLKKVSEYSVPEEFQKLLDKKATLKKAFEALTPGRQRAYLLFFSQAKQVKTREARIAKHIPDIMAGKGLND